MGIMLEAHNCFASLLLLTLLLSSVYPSRAFKSSTNVASSRKSSQADPPNLPCPLAACQSCCDCCRAMI